MKIAHLADLHLGFRRYDRQTHHQNAREADVATAFRLVVDDVIAQRPDAIVIAGDVFHRPTPHNAPIILLFSQLTKVRQALPETRVVLVEGNHDAASTVVDWTSILPLYRHLGIDVVLKEPAVLPVRGGTITAVPSAAAATIVKPDPQAALNVLVIHGQIPSSVYPLSPSDKDLIDRDELERMGWDYVALGDYHVCHQVGPQMWYSGAIEYTSSDAWSELKKQNELLIPGKGYLLVEPPNPPTFRPIPTRRHIDLPPIEGTDKTAAQLDAEIAGRVAETEIDGAVVRLVVREVRRDVKRALNHAQLREWQARALHFQLDLRIAESEQSTPATRARMHHRLDETVAHFLRGWPKLSPDLNREEVVEKGLEYLKAVSEDPYSGEAVSPGLASPPA